MRRTIVIVRKKIAKGTEKLTQAPRGPMAKGRLNPAGDEHGNRGDWKSVTPAVVPLFYCYFEAQVTVGYPD